GDQLTERGQRHGENSECKQHFVQRQAAPFETPETRRILFRLHFSVSWRIGPSAGAAVNPRTEICWENLSVCTRSNAPSRAVPSGRNSIGVAQLTPASVCGLESP